METPYDLPNVKEIPSLSLPELMDTQRNIANHMWELRHKFSEDGIKQSKYNAAQHYLWVENARNIRRLIQDELLKRKSQSGQRKRTAEKTSEPVHEVLNLKPSAARLVLKERRKKEKLVNYYHTERQPKELPIIKRQQKTNITSKESVLKEATSRSSVPRLSSIKNTLQTTHNTEAETILLTETKEQQKVEIIKLSNILTHHSSQTQRTSQKTRSKSKSKKKKSGITAMMLEILERTRVNNGPVILGKPSKQPIKPEDQHIPKGKYTEEELQPYYNSRTIDTHQLKQNRQEILANMKVRPQNKDTKRSSNTLNSKSHKKLVSMVRQFESKKTKIKYTNQILIQQPIEEDIKVQQGIKEENDQTQAIKSKEQKDPDWSYQNQFLEPPQIREQLQEDSENYQSQKKRQFGNRSFRKILFKKPQRIRFSKDSVQDSRA